MMYVLRKRFIKKSAFSFVEVIVTMAVVSVLFAITLPHLATKKLSAIPHGTFKCWVAPEPNNNGDQLMQQEDNNAAVYSRECTFNKPKNVATFTVKLRGGGGGGSRAGSINSDDSFFQSSNGEDSEEIQFTTELNINEDIKIELCNGNNSLRDMCLGTAGTGGTPQDIAGDANPDGTQGGTSYFNGRLAQGGCGGISTTRVKYVDCPTGCTKGNPEAIPDAPNANANNTYTNAGSGGIGGNYNVEDANTQNYSNGGQGSGGSIEISW